MSDKTSRQFETVIAECRQVFLTKMKDYGSSWRILRTSSITDQIYIKANRIRSIEEKGTQKINEGIKPEFIGIVNYSVMALIQLGMGDKEELELDMDTADKLFSHHILKTRDLMLDKNHDYGEAWRNMRISSFTDIILMRVLRIKQIEDHKGQTLASEGVDANYMDVINYAVFALIKMMEENGS